MTNYDKMITGFLIILFGMVSFQAFQVNPFFDLQESEFSIDQDWGLQGSLNNLETDGDKIYPLKNENGSFESDIETVSEGSLSQINYVANIDQGSGNITVLGWNNYSTGKKPNETQTFELKTGNNTLFINDSKEFEDFQVVIDLNESDGSNDKIPNVDSVNVLWGINQDFQVFTSEILGVLVVLIGFFIALSEL